MKIRLGFVTNSSSTSFLVLSKDEITPEYLLTQLGFKRGSVIANEGYKLACEIVDSLSPYYRDITHNVEPITKDYIAHEFGEESALVYVNKIAKGWHAYIGDTGSDSHEIITFFTTDSTIIKSRKIYIDARQCMW